MPAQNVSNILILICWVLAVVSIINSKKTDSSYDDIVEQILKEKNLSPPHESGPNYKMSRSWEDDNINHMGEDENVRGLSFLRDNTRKADNSNDEIVEQILKEKNLSPPHESGPNNKMVRSSEDDNDNHMGRDENSNGIKMEINNLKKALDGCNEKTERLLKDLVEKTMNETNENLEIPYLKQIFRVFLSVVDKSNHSETQDSAFRFQVRNSNNKILQRCLDDEESAQTCVDSLTNFLKSGHVIPPYDFFEKFFNFFEKIKVETLVYALIGVGFIGFALYGVRIVLSRNTFMGIFFLLVVSSFLLSVPWEWMRMYKMQLAKKAADTQSSAAECFGNNTSYVKMLKWWAQNTFSFSDDECSKYYQAMMVDPVWEVTPAQAVSATASRMFLQPCLHIAEHAGKFFRLFFKEVPVQWQPFFFIAFFVCFLFAIGIQIYTPLLRIGRGGDKGNEIKFLKQQLEEEKRYVAELKGKNQHLEQEKAEQQLRLQAPKHPEVQIPQISAHGVEELPEREKNNAVPAPPSHSENLLSHQPPIEQNQSDQQLPSTEQDQWTK